MENKKIVTVQMTEEFYNKVMVDVPVEGGSEEMVYYNVQKGDLIDYDFIETLIGITYASSKTSVPIAYCYSDIPVFYKYLSGILPSQISALWVRYIAIPNRVTVPPFVSFGSNHLPLEDFAGKSMTLYEFFETINDVLIEFTGASDLLISIDEIKAHEVTKEEVTSWFNREEL